MSKIITINPELFKRKKTKKKTIISDKLINKTLINRIKEKKTKPQEINTNKFDESDNFLTTILKKYPKNETLKVNAPLNNYPHPSINKSIENILFKPTGMDVIDINYKLDNEKPYGNMKGGLKPTMKNWKLGKKIKQPNHIKAVNYSEEEEAKRIMESEINKAINGKTQFSTDLLEKFQGVGDDKIVISDEDIKIEPEILTTPFVTKIDKIEIDLNPMKVCEPVVKPVCLEPIDLNLDISTDIKPISFAKMEKEMENEKVENEKVKEKEIEIVKEVLEPETEIVNIQVNQTIKRKYHLGKKNGELGIIIPNKKTQKDKSELIKKIKSTTSEDMKKTLKKQGLIQVGSCAPNEVVRNIYNNAQLAGFVFNENKDVLLSNLLDN